MLYDADSKVTSGLNYVSKNLSKGLDMVNRNLSTVFQIQAKLENLYHKDHVEL